jgi:agmatinase
VPRRGHWFGLNDETIANPGVAILGLPWVGAANRRSGAALAPGKLRELSTTSDPIGRRGRLVEELRVRDYGDVPAEDHGGGALAWKEYMARAAARIDALPREAFTLLLGGDNSVSIPGLTCFARRYGADAGVIWFDAHADLFEAYDGNLDSHACALRRGMALSGISPSRAVLLSTRSLAREELAFIEGNGIEMVTASEWLGSSADAIAARIAARLAGAPAVYLAVDIDGFDASCAPGTGYPMPGGIGAETFFLLLERLFEQLPMKGMDLTEIAPPLDVNDVTGFLGIQVVLETLGALDAKVR